MVRDIESSLITIPRWNRIPSILHGFGLKGWTAAALKSRWPESVLVTMKQVHSDRINFLSAIPSGIPVGDGLATDRPGLILAVKTADCLPILLADPGRRVVAALHCGWRGTAGRLAEKAVAALGEHYGSSPNSLLAAFGPCIQKNCYEVGEDVRSCFAEAGLPLENLGPHPSRRGKYLLDLQGANRNQLLRAGLDPGQMNFIGDCTHCQPSMFSYRREEDAAGRMLSFVGIRLVTSD